MQYRVTDEDLTRLKDMIETLQNELWAKFIEVDSSDLEVVIDNWKLTLKVIV